MGMEVVLPDGEIAWLGSKCVKDVAGYSMKDLFVGSEGTLGIITKVLLKLVPRPKARRTLLASFDSMEAAAGSVSKIIERQIIPCTLEFLDRKTCQSVEDYAKVGLPTSAAAVVLMETDGHPAVVEEEAAAMEAIARESGAISVEKAADEAHAVRLATARAAHSPRSPGSGDERSSRTSPCPGAISPRSCPSSRRSRRATASRSRPSVISGTGTSTPPSSPTKRTTRKWSASTSPSGDLREDDRTGRDDHG